MQEINDCEINCKISSHIGLKTGLKVKRSLFPVCATLFEVLLPLSSQLAKCLQFSDSALLEPLGSWLGATCFFLVVR